MRVGRSFCRLGDQTHEAETVVWVFGFFDEFIDARLVANLVQHGQDRFIRAAVRRAPQRCNTRRNHSIGVRARGAGDPDRGGRSILLVISVQDEDLVHRAR